MDFHDKTTIAYDAVQAFEEEFDAKFMELIDAWYERGPGDDDWPDVITHVVFDASSESQYTYPAVRFAEEHGLYLFDAVAVNGYEAEERYDRSSVIELRFGVADDAGVDDT